MTKEVTTEQDQTFYLTFLGPINDTSAPGLMQVCNKIVFELNFPKLHILLSTPGGSVNFGIVLYHFLTALPVSLTTHNIGSVDSIGNVIFLAGKDRFAAPGSTFLFHGVASQLTGSFSYTQLTEIVSQLKEDENRIEMLVTEKSAMEATQVRSLFSQGKSLSCEEALEKKIATQIIRPNIPRNAQSAVLNFNSQQ